MQTLFWLKARALMKLGMAMAANRAMMATTIIISTNVNPALGEGSAFMLLLLSNWSVLITFQLVGREHWQKAGYYLLKLRSFTDCLLPTAGAFQAADVPFSSMSRSLRRASADWRVCKAFNTGKVFCHC
jgi:hypothetical protein